MGKRVQRIPSWPGVKRFTPTKAVYICADQLVTSSHFACGEAADHTFRFANYSGVGKRHQRTWPWQRLSLVTDAETLQLTLKSDSRGNARVHYQSSDVFP